MTLYITCSIPYAYMHPWCFKHGLLCLSLLPLKKIKIKLILFHYDIFDICMVKSDKYDETFYSNLPVDVFPGEHQKLLIHFFKKVIILRQLPQLLYLQLVDSKLYVCSSLFISIFLNVCIFVS